MIVTKTGNKINKLGGFLPIITPDGEIILKFRTRGTCFPARADGYTTRSCYFQVFSQYGVANTVYIDYSDGTGEHVYSTDGVGTEMIRWFCTSSTDPNQVSGSNSYDVRPNDGNGGGEFGIHFYQDLVDTEKINTVDHAYVQERDIYIRFEKAQNIEQLFFYNMVILADFPSVARLRNLKKLYLYYLLTLNSFNNEAVNTLLEEISLADLGITSNTLPIWVKNSPVSDLSIDSYLVTNTAQEFETEIIIPLKDTLEILSMDGVPVNYALPESFSELTKLKSLSLERGYPAKNFAFPSDLSTLTDFKILSLKDKITFPISQVKRFIKEVPTTGKSINIRTFGATLENKDFVLDNYDYSVEEFDASYGRWNNGVPPTCIGQMKALKTLNMYGSYNYAVSNGSYSLTNWGDFSGATALESISFKWQQKMDLTFPTWLTNLPNFKTFDCHASFETQQSIDGFVDSVYSFVVTNASMAIGNTPFRQMNIITYSRYYPLDSWRPTGILQEPVGYVQESNNGNPATPMEKIYVLTNQYEHSWILKS